ncbi:ATP-dependent zinc protease family protein [Sinobacterium caligoides]|uniref:ATP-dependent zinc protease family protein n=1 Tax=Sinobacterium caligoides TaxID=933926 RepID=UPI0013C32EF3|nr:RimK/LysX family protein [Sinobacterium caligoides]
MLDRTSPSVQEPAPVPPAVEVKVPTPSVTEKPVTKPTHKPQQPRPTQKPERILPATKLSMFGALEYVKLSPGDLVLEARIDTGAKSTSISAVNIQEFERDGKKWVKFNIPTGEDQSVELKRPLIRYTVIKRHGEESLRRPVVSLRLTIGKIEQRIEVNLTDRVNYDYPALIGRNFLKDYAVVDVSQKHRQGKPK